MFVVINEFLTKPRSSRLSQTVHMQYYVAQYTVYLQLNRVTRGDDYDYKKT